MSSVPQTLYDVTRDLGAAERDELIHLGVCRARRAGERCQSCLDHAARVTDLSRQADELVGVMP